jgi:hypothetical protein
LSSELFPVSKVHKLIQNFLQSLEPSFLVCGCPPSLLCICVRFASLIWAISSRSFLIRSDTSLGINTVYFLGRTRARPLAGTHSQGKLPDVQFGFALLSARLLEID